MFRHAIYVTSLITVLVVCLHIHKAISENDIKYWLRDEQFWPSIQKYRNLLKKSKVSVGVDTKYDASNIILPISRKHQRDQEGLDMQVNIRPRFRVNIDAEQRGDYHGEHGRERNVPDMIHSRESYIRSQASQTLKTPEPIPKIDKSPKKNGNNLQNFKNGPSPSENKENENNEPYLVRAKIHKKTKFTAIHAEMTTSSNSFVNKKKRLYSEEKLQYRVTNIGNNLRDGDIISTRGRKKKGRDFDLYKKERDFERDEQKLDKESKKGSKKDYFNSETRNKLDRFKAERDLDKKEQKIDKKEKNGLKEHHRLSEERHFDRYKKERKQKRQHDKEQSRMPNILREHEPDYEREKYSKGVYVTKGYNEHEEPPNEKNESYESIETISEEQQQSNFHENIRQTKKISAPFYPRYPQIDTHNMWPSLRTGEHGEEFIPSSIAQQLSSIKKKCKEAVIEQEVIGRTSGGNEIVLWKIQEKRPHRFRRSKKKYVDEPPEKKIVFIVHGLSVMGWHDLDCLSKPKRFNTLLDYYLENLDSFDIYLIPMANPDGVEKIKNSKWWNKNTSPQYACSGVNLDRNFDVHWNATHGSTLSTCHQRYPGQKPFSEYETRSVREVFHRYGHKIVAYFHVHAGTYDDSVFKGDAVLYPRGYMVQQTEDDKYVDMKADIDEAMRNTSFKTLSVTVDTLHNWHGEVVGTSVDYASTVIGIPYSLELVMQVYKDCPQVKNPDNREKNAALVEIWQILIDVIFDSIYRNAIKPNEP